MKLSPQLLRKARNSESLIYAKEGPIHTVSGYRENSASYFSPFVFSTVPSDRILESNKPETVEVFRTNVGSSIEAMALAEVLRSQFPASRITFDLNDCDKVLRVEGKGICVDSIIQLLNAKGNRVEVLE